MGLLKNISGMIRAWHMNSLAGIWKPASVLPGTQTSDAVVLNPPAASADVIAAGDFLIDMDARSVTVRGRKLHLSRAEFDVLVFLTSHRKRMVTSSTLLTTKSEECGQSHTEFMRALLSLRKKLQEEVPRAQYIQTEAWILYDFHAGTDPQ